MSKSILLVPKSANAIRAKLQQRPNQANRLFFEEANRNGFSIFSFIDDTLIQFARPGGPIGNDEGVPRVPLDIQQAEVADCSYGEWYGF